MKNNDLIGTWSIVDSSRQRLPEKFRKLKSIIVLNPNTTFIASDIPGLLYVNPGPIEINTGKGLWKIVSREGEQQIQLEFNTVDNWNGGNTPFGTQLYISTKRHAVNLYYFLGGPDEGLKIEFAKSR